MFVQNCICQLSIRIIQWIFSLWVNFLLSLILQSLTSDFFVSIALCMMEPATNFTLPQSSIIIICFNHVAHKHSSKKVKIVLAVYRSYKNLHRLLHSRSSNFWRKCPCTSKFEARNLLKYRVRIFHEIVCIKR